MTENTVQSDIARLIFDQAPDAIIFAGADGAVQEWNAAAEQITCELAPGSVELRLRGRDPEFVVTLPPVDLPADEPAEVTAPPVFPDGDEGTVARINLRLPDQLKTRVEQAAAGESLSVNSWLVRAAAAALERSDPTRRRDRRPAQGNQSYTGWVR